MPSAMTGALQGEGGKKKRFDTVKQCQGGIDDHRLSFPLKKMCRALEVSRSGYYAFKTRPKSQNRIDNEKLLIEINRVFRANDRNYGSPRIWDQLHTKEHRRCSLNRVARIITLGALRRDESRGSHYKPDFPNRDDAHWLKTTVAKFTPTGPEFSDEAVDTSLLQPKARVY